MRGAEESVIGGQRGRTYAGEGHRNKSSAELPGFYRRKWMDAHTGNRAASQNPRTIASMSPADARRRASRPGGAASGGARDGARRGVRRASGTLPRRPPPSAGGAPGGVDQTPQDSSDRRNSRRRGPVAVRRESPSHR